MAVVTVDAGGGGSRFPVERAIRICQEAVAARIEGDGFRDIRFERVVPDNNPGRNDWVVGIARARRGPGSSAFSFDCSVDFSSGRVRSVDVRRR